MYEKYFSHSIDSIRLRARSKLQHKGKKINLNKWRSLFLHIETQGISAMQKC